MSVHLLVHSPDIQHSDTGLKFGRTVVNIENGPNRSKVTPTVYPKVKTPPPFKRKVMIFALLFAYGIAQENGILNIY